MALVLIIGFLTVCVYKAKIKNWLYNKSSEIYESRSSSSSIVSASENTNSATIHNNKLFDVYVSYSIRDSEFVDHSLAPTLEHGPTAYRLCLHQRDFPPSASIYDTVSVASESSSRILLVLSKSYLEYEWPQVKLPLRSTANGSNGKLVILMLEDIPKEMMDSELQKYMKTCAIVKWGSSGYLNKLRFFLPEPAFLTFQRSVTLRTLHQSPMSVLSSSSSSTASSSIAAKMSFAQPLSDQAWAYTVESSPVDSVVQSHDARVHQLHRQLRGLQPGSIYSHHTYQSIPEGHIYHTLEPEIDGKPGEQVGGKPTSVYINKNLELILKPPATMVLPINSNLPEMVEEEADEDDDDVKPPLEDDQNSEPAEQESPKSPSQNKNCHHSHSKSTLSEQHLIPSSADCSTDEYIV